MIDTTLYFDRDIDLDDLLEKLKKLPASIRPVYFSESKGEIIKGNQFSNKENFHVFMKNNPKGFFLYTEDKTCIHISIPTTGYIRLSMSLDGNFSRKLIKIIFQFLANKKLIFGYSCDYNEYKHRNQYDLMLGNSQIESWVGRRLDKYIPGVYWYTLLSERLMKQHGIKIEDIIPQTVASESLGDSALHLLKFFEKPEEWAKNADRMDNLCEKIDGLFSRRDVEKAMAGVTKLFEYEEAIANWR